MFKKWCACPNPSIVGNSIICGTCYREIEIPKLASVLRENADQVKSREPNREIPRDTEPSTFRLDLHPAAMAIKSAKIVNAWGSGLQIIGFIVGLIYIVLGGYIGMQMDNILGGIVVGTVVGSIFIAFAAFQGALLRMVANYIIARLSR
jgi:hypothetical protein